MISLIAFLLSFYGQLIATFAVVKNKDKEAFLLPFPSA